MTTSGLASSVTLTANGLGAAFTVFPVSLASAASNLVIFSAIFASNESEMSLLCFANNWAANLPMLAGLTMKAFEDPGGFVRQVLFIPSGGQETTGKVAKYDAVPDSASVPPAQPTIMGLSELLYSPITDCKRPGCLWAEQILVSASTLNLPNSFLRFSRCGMSESDPAAMTAKGCPKAASAPRLAPLRIRPYCTSRIVMISPLGSSEILRFWPVIFSAMSEYVFETSRSTDCSSRLSCDNFLRSSIRSLLRRLSGSGKCLRSN